MLKVADLTKEDQIEMIKMGYGEILNNPTAYIPSEHRRKDQVNMEVEHNDPLRASQITFKFVVLKTSMHAKAEILPKRVYFQLRFFNFPEVHTDSVSMFEPGIRSELQIVRPGGTYYLAKDRMDVTGKGKVQR